MERQSITAGTLKAWVSDLEASVKEMKSMVADSERSPEHLLKKLVKTIVSTDLVGSNVKLFKKILQSREEA